MKSGGEAVRLGRVLGAVANQSGEVTNHRPDRLQTPRETPRPTSSHSENSFQMSIVTG